jgi:hypothetical protein
LHRNREIAVVWLTAAPKAPSASLLVHDMRQRTIRNVNNEEFVHGEVDCIAVRALVDWDISIRVEHNGECSKPVLQ